MTSESRFKHYHRPTVTEDPKVVEACYRWIQEGNYYQVAHLAQSRGLPPQFRLLAWPLLLENHPYVLNPHIVPEYPSDEQPQQFITISRRRLTADLTRARIKVAGKHRSSPSPEEQQRRQQVQSQQHDRPQKSQQNSPIESSNPDITSSGVSSDVNSGITSGNASPNTTATKSMIIQPGCSAANSTTAISTIDTSVARPVGNSQNGSSYSSASSPTGSTISSLASSPTDFADNIIIEAVELFLEKWGKYAPYDNGMMYVALAVAEWVNPEMLHYQTNYQFSKVFEHALLVILHGNPTSGADGPSGPCDSPLAHLISFFLSAFRRLLPDLKDHFDEEELLGLGGEEWLLWWIKWAGARVWHPTDRARVWDMYFGWNQTEVPSELDAASDITDATTASSVPDTSPFWNPLELESTLLDPHTQHVFVCLAALKSKRSTLMELDQSEIRQFLNRFGKFDDTESIITEAGEIWRSWHWAEESDE